MKKICSFVLVFFAYFLGFSQALTGNQLLEKSIQFHDPNGNWNAFKGSFMVTMKTPKSSPRKSYIEIDLPEEYFLVKAIKDTLVTQYTLRKGFCSMAINGNTTPSEKLLKKHQLSCERANLYKNYYSYLYGLPMKLKDEGTIIHQKIATKTFKGKEYLVLKVTYKKEVGSDTWYFYFDPKTYAMEVYQFFKTEKDSGEYILLSGLETINDIRMPKKRAWYYNKNEEYLGTDILSKK
tara:strand:+ start:846 stop:1553 length:708 start_codon:yes stop_codon:yes gene_type:complete